MSLAAFFEDSKTKAAAQFNQYGQHIPVFVLCDPDDRVVVLPTPWSDHNEKALAVLAAKEIAKSINATRVVVITEGWMVTRPTGTPTEGLVPSQQPDRIEVLWICAQSKSEGARTGFFHIDRDAAGKAKVGAWASCDDGMSVSLFDGIVGAGVLQ
jgi:hypothetical protein